MFIAHLPSGYIAAKWLSKHIKSPLISYRYFLISALFGAIAPDFDLLYFYFVDHRQHHHHIYLTHYPIGWIILLLMTFPIGKIIPAIKNKIICPQIFLFCGVIHLILDSVVGDIWWFAPFIDQPFSLATVPRLVDPWWLNFFIHWSFLLEIALVIWAIVIYTAKKPLRQK